MHAVSKEQTLGDFSARMPLDWTGIDDKIIDMLNDITYRKVIPMIGSCQASCRLR